VIDQGNGGADGGGIGRIAKAGPAVVFDLLQQLEALGLNVPTVLQQLGVTSAASNGESTAPTVPVITGTPAPERRKN
jgi:hypothetical protein